MRKKNRLGTTEYLKPSGDLAINQQDVDEPKVGFTTLLAELHRGDASPPDLQADLGGAFRFVYDSWVERGGFEKGKPRHSARQIREWLGSNDQIRSLETKLAGKTRLQYQDAFTLLKLMLSYWEFDENSGKYAPYRKDGLDVLTRDFIGDLYPDGVKSLLLPDRSRQGKATRNAKIPMGAEPSSNENLTEPSGGIIQEAFKVSDVLVTVSRVRTIIGTDPPTAMTGFHHLMESLYSIDKSDHRKRTLIWINDLGLRNDKTASRGAIYNLFFLMAQFRSIALIEWQGRDDLYRWLQANSCIIVGSLERTEIDRIYSRIGIDCSGDPDQFRWFQPDRLFLESVPWRWLKPTIRDAFGRTEDEIWTTPTITAHLRTEDWDHLDHSHEVDTQRNLRYFYHGQIARSQGDVTSGQSRCIDLEEPGSRWSDAYRLAIQGALGCLGRSWDKKVSSVEPSEALLQLREAGFAALTLDGLLYLPEVLITERLKQNR